MSGDAARPVLMALELEMDALFAVRKIDKQFQGHILTE